MPNYRDLKVGAMSACAFLTCNLSEVSNKIARIIEK